MNLPTKIEYQYDTYKGISSIYTLYKYIIQNGYDANGAKQRTFYIYETKQAGSLRPPLYASRVESWIDYCENIVYVNDTLDKILLPDGYVTKNNNKFVYHYYIKDHQGNNRVVLKEDGTIEQVNHYYPFGALFAGTIGQAIQEYKYNSKKLDRMYGLNWYDYNRRSYDPILNRFTTMDPLAEMDYSVSPYVYCRNNPVRYFDPDGLYPRSVLTYDAKLGLYGGYRFTQSAAHLLSLVSGVSRVYIDNTIVQERAPGQYRPFYSAKEGGGAITLGSGALNSNITYTENWFADDPSAYNGHGYGQDVMGWLGLSSHEIGHLPQISKAGGFFSYLWGFAKEYAKSGHDAAPSEIEADKGYKTFSAFNSFVNKTYGAGSMENLFNSNARESKKVETITTWWNAYQETQNQQTKSFLNNFQNLEQGTYKWNGSSWERQ